MSSPSPASPAMTVPDRSSLDFVMRSGTGTTGAHDDLRKPSVLEVAGVWSDTVTDVQHVRRGAHPVTGGSSTGMRWRFLGMPLGWVPSSFGAVAWMLAPMLSEATEEWKSDFFIPAEYLPEDEFQLFVSRNGAFVGRFCEDWDGFVDVGSERIPFATLVATGRARRDADGTYTIPIAEDTRIVAELGDVVIVGQMVPDSTRIKPRPGAGIDPVFAGVMSMCATVFAMLMMVLWTAPPPPESTVAALDDRVASLVIHRPIPAAAPDLSPKKTRADNPGAKAKKAEGRVGQRNATQKQAKGKRSRSPKRTLDRQVVASAGIFGVMSNDRALADTFGTSAISDDFATGLGSAIGVKGVQLGSRGLGSRGGALGGGGTADTLGGLDTEGRGRGPRGFGPDAGGLTQKTSGRLSAIAADPIILGSLDKSLIDEVIRRHMNQIRYCYQRELTRSPGLAGKMTIKFVIDGSGQVSSTKVRSSSMGNAAVEACITNRFMRFTFPEPKGNGIVMVSYPLLFSAG